MASFVAVVDPDPIRRAAYVASVLPSLALLPERHVGQCSTGAFAALWAAGPRAPVSAAADSESAGVVWGDALAPDGGVVDSAVLREAWRVIPDGLPPAWNGFHAAVRYGNQAGTLVAGADLFGLFPVYYWTKGEILLVGSSIESFRRHPLYRSAINPVGITGVLLTGGLLDGDTVWTDVRRLPPGSLLSWSPTTRAREIRQYSMSATGAADAGSFEDHVSMIDGALDDVLARHVPSGRTTGLLLSGGRDSRVVAGALHRRGIPTHALTLGEAHDHEVRCARSVARQLGFRHTVASDPLTDVEAMVRRHVRVEQLANGLANFYTWDMVPLLGPLGERVLSGYSVERYIGGTARALPGSPADGDAFDRVRKKTLSYGIHPSVLRRVLRQDVFGAALDECEERLRAQFVAGPADVDRCAWEFDAMHRGRHHAGSTPWRMSQAAWPSLLAIDQSFINVCASLPAASVVGRRAEDALLRTRFPALARLPLDRNSARLEPLLPSVAWRARRRLGERMPLAVRRSFNQWRGERRRYYRLYDINAPIWRTVRHMAEAVRARASDVLDPSALASLLPAPDVRIELREPITDSNGLKALLGFMIWWSEYG
jgi:asparagine synthase (glutamine-hydrolysing)